MREHDSLAGTTVDGRYHVQEDLGEDRGTSLYTARQSATNRVVWLRVLPRSLVGDTAIYESCRRRVRAASSLRHPNTLTTYAYGQTEDGRFYVVTEAPAGPTLGDVLASVGPLPVERAAHIAAEVCGSLTEAHAIGVVHGAISPNAIIVEPRDGEPDGVRVGDYGVGELLFREADGRGFDGRGFDGKDYQSAEASGEDVRLDARSDLYSLGVTLFEMLAGRKASGTGNVVASLWEVQSEREIPVALDSLLASALARASEDRVPSAGVFRERLEDVLGRAVCGESAVRIRKLSEYRRATEASELSRDRDAPMVLLRRQTSTNSALPRAGRTVRLRRHVIRRAVAFVAVGLVALAIAVTSVLLLRPWRKTLREPNPNAVVVSPPSVPGATGAGAGPAGPVAVAPAAGPDAGSTESGTAATDVVERAGEADAEEILIVPVAQDAGPASDAGPGDAGASSHLAGTVADTVAEPAAPAGDTTPGGGLTAGEDSGTTAAGVHARPDTEKLRERGGRRERRVQRERHGDGGHRARGEGPPRTPKKPEERPQPRHPRRVDLEPPDF